MANHSPPNLASTSAGRHADGVGNVTTGIIQISAGMLIVPILDVFAKLLGNDLDPVEVTFMRFIMQALLMAPFVIYFRLWTIPRGTLLLQSARGVLLAIATVCFFAALQHMPIAEAISIYFAQPMILTILSALLLGETIRARRIIAIIIGLIGTCVILQPSIMVFGLPAIYPLGSSISMAFYIVLTRRLAHEVNPFQMQFMVGVVAMLVLGFALLIGNQLGLPGTRIIMPTMQHIWWVIGMGLAATIGHGFIVLAAAHAPANVLAPFQYLEIIGATLFGYLVFGDVPAPSTVIGVIIIISSGLYLFYRERQLKADTAH